MEERETAISVRDVNKIYKLYDKPKDRLKEALGLGRKQVHKQHYALNGVSLNIYKGETVGIIGTNGSGKSTILKIITGVLNPTGGEVRVAGRISALLELGAGFNMEYNGIENVYLNGTMMGFSEKEIDEKLPEILKFADIGDYVNQPVKTYSSGMFVRLAFAVAINIEPEILIVDEALSVGDVFFQAKCYHKFEEFKRLGKTIVFVSHDLSSISKYCDRVFLLNKGTLLGEGTPKEMIDAYKRVLVGQYEPQQKVRGEGLKHSSETCQGDGQELKHSSEPCQGDGKEEEPERRLSSEMQCGGRTERSRSSKACQGDGQERRTAAETQDGGIQCRDAAPEADRAEGGPEQRINPGALEYGSGEAEIVEYYLTDEQGIRTCAVIKGSRFTLHMRVKFHAHIPGPIFAFSIKNAIGTEITGTNTLIEKAFLESAEPGQIKEAFFTQKMSLQGGEYLLSMGVTGYRGDTFEVYHRLYDALAVTVVSDKDTVGYYDMESVVKVLDAAEIDA